MTSLYKINSLQQDVGAVYHCGKDEVTRLVVPGDLPITKLESRGSVITLLAGITD